MNLLSIIQYNYVLILFMKDQIKCCGLDLKSDTYRVKLNKKN